MTAVPSGLAHALQDRYRIDRELGQGGMATVYLAEDLKHHRKVAVKVLRPDLAATLGPERFIREITIAAGLSHPHILPLHDSGEANGFLYFVMPYVEGQSLRDKLAREGELPIPDAVRILRDVADAMAYAHRHGVVHRDLKPENVMLSERHAMVTDFGVAKAVSEATGRQTLTTAGVALGTPTYMAPEQATADPHTDHRADIYGFGALAYELLAGRPPFTGATPQAVLAAHVTMTPDPVTRYRASIPPALAALVMRCLEKRPADRWQTIDELLPQLEAALTPSGGTTPSNTQPIHVARSRRWRAAGIAIAVTTAAAIGAFFLLRPRTTPGFDPNLIAVTPFDVLDPKLALWHEGMVDVLSRALDGAGPLRTVSPSVVIHRWSGRADPASAAALGRATGSGLVVFGTLQAGGDSVRVDATLLDAATGRSLGEVTVRQSEARLDRLCDSLAVGLLRHISQTMAIAAVRRGSMGAGSLPALKAFLKGEQEFRHAQYDSARTSLEQALALDTAFAPALRRLSNVLEWIGYVADSAGVAYGLRAGRLNHGLAPRDSLLITADSLFAAMGHPAGADVMPLQRRLFATTAEAVRRYPEDAEAWYQYGDARMHYGNAAEASQKDVLAAFQRSIAIDSEFAPPYYHAVEYGLRELGPDSVRRYARRLLSLHPSTQTQQIEETILQLLDSGGPTPARVKAIGERITPRVRGQARNPFWGYPDSAETDVGLTSVEAGEDSGLLIAMMLIARGHLREAADLLKKVPSNAPRDFRAGVGLQLALLGGRLPDSYEAWFVRSLDGPFWPDTVPVAGAAVPIWAGRRDTVHLKRFEKVMDSLARNPRASGDVRRSLPTIRAFLTLARGDSAAALQQLMALPDTAYDDGVIRFTRANLLIAAGRDAEAANQLEHPYWTFVPISLDVPRMLERGRVAERLGKREVAIESYQWVMATWRNADPELQPLVAESRQALSRLSAEPQKKN